MTDQGVRGNAPSPDPTRAGSPELAAAFGRPPGVAESFAPAPLPPPRRANLVPQLPSTAQRRMFGRPDGQHDPFDPPPGSRPDPRPTPESPWWKPDAARDPWRDAGSLARLGAPPDLDGQRPADAEPLPDLIGSDQGRRRWRLRQLSFTAAIVLLIGALLAGIGGGVTGYLISSRVKSALLDPDATLTTVSPPVNRPPGSIADIAKRVLPAVVSIEVRSSSGAGTGSGVVVAADGYILTNNHVVSTAATNSGTMRALFQDQTAAPARIVGRDPKSDLAVIKVEKRGLTVATLGDSSSMAVGDPVIAIGSPLGLAGTVTSGIVSALNRPVRLDGQGSDTNAVINAIQTDAAINPGNSGGALVDGAGAVVGINSAIATLSSGGRASEGGSIGVGFAIPINEARDIAQQLIRTGSVKHATLGLTAKSVTDGSRDGALIESISPGGAAAKAGLQEGDVITKVDKVAITGYDHLIVTIRAHHVGDKIALSYVRGGSTRNTSATLQSD
jgi:S1-C subfamily serine protease